MRYLEKKGEKRGSYIEVDFEDNSLPVSENLVSHPTPNNYSSQPLNRKGYCSIATGTVIPLITRNV